MFFSGNFTLPALLEVAAKIYCIVHIIRNDRSWLWIWLILFVPFIGPVVYFIVEILPDLKRGTRRFNVPASRPRTRSIAKIQEELEFSNTVEKRAELARALAAAKRYPEAIETLRECLRGAFKDDPLLVMELAEIHFMAGEHQDALGCLETLDRVQYKDHRSSRHILAARSQEMLGSIDRAKRSYELALETAIGDEARCRYALLLAKNGETGAARKLCQEILGSAKHAGGAYRRENREWIDQARTLMDSLGASG